MEYLESIVPINPLHGPPAIKGVKACRAVLTNQPHVGVFDTSFYSTLEPKAYMYALPYEWYEKYGIRKYGFHGTSHRYVAAKAAEYVGKPIEELKIVTCHIGSGSSITAVDCGKAIDTSMGFTPQDGLPMGTRCGAIDPSLVTYVMKQTGMTPDEMDTAMNKKSGLLGVSGVSNDGRDVWKAADEGNERAKLAMDLMCQGAIKLIGAYVAEMNGLDVLVFTAGVGENDRRTREMVAGNLSFFGVKFDAEKNANAPHGDILEISLPDSATKVLVIPTDEEFMIACDTETLAKAL
jgi:acetate kinase